MAERHQQVVVGRAPGQSAHRIDAGRHDLHGGKLRHQAEGSVERERVCVCFCVSCLGERVGECRDANLRSTVADDDDDDAEKAGMAPETRPV